MKELQPVEILYFHTLIQTFSELEHKHENDYYAIALPKAIRNRFLETITQKKEWHISKEYGNNLHPFKNNWISLTDFSIDAFEIPDTEFNKYESDSIYRFYNNKGNYFYAYKYSATYDNSSHNSNHYLMIPKDHLALVKKLYVEFVKKYLSNAILDGGFEPVKNMDGEFNEEHYVITEDMKFLFNDLEKFLNNKKFYTENSLPYKRGILLCGSPGNGKSFALKYIRKHFDIPIVIPRDMTEYENYISPGFDVAKTINKITGKPVVIFIEEVNVVMNELNGRERFLELLDGVESDCQFYFIGTTNKPEALDKAILNRPSRIDNIIDVKPPQLEDRVKYFQSFFTKWNEEQINTVAKLTDTFSFAYLKNVVIEYIYEKDRNVFDSKLLDTIIKRQTKHMKNDANALAESSKDKSEMGFGRGNRSFRY